MPHNKKSGSHGSGGMSLVSILMSALSDIIVNKKVNKVLDKVKKDPNVNQSVKSFKSSVDKLGSSLKTYCEKYPEYCQDLLNDPALKKKYLE